MKETSLLREVLKKFRRKLWAKAGKSGMAMRQKDCLEVIGCCAVSHEDDVWPIHKAVHNDEVGLATITKVSFSQHHV